jgi:hypothetical protein
MSETVKQEGEFKLKTNKQTPKKLAKTNEPIKVDLTNARKQEEPTKVLITKDSENAIQKQSTDESLLVDEGSQMGLQEVGEGNPVDKEITSQSDEEEVILIQEITDEEVKQEVAKIEQAVQEYKEENTGKPLPENIEKLVSFMEETGGTVEDYVRLNTDYSNVDTHVLLKEYYKSTRPHLDQEEIEFLIEDNFDYDEDLDDERDVKKKRLAFKEEVAKAKTYLETVKSKYYDEIKLRPGVTQDQQKAMDFFNRYQKDQESAEARHFKFKTDTKDLFSNEFKGFDFKVGEKNFRYGVTNQEAIVEKQSDISNLIKKFLNKNGEIEDVKGYHKAIYAAENVDTIAKHFYEQGKADAIREVVAKSNNLVTEPRTVANANAFINGLKVKAINGVDTSKLKVQTKRFNN